MSEVHIFNVDVAKKVGVHAAVILQNLHHWIAHNEANGKNIHDGRGWTYNSVRAFADLFPYFTEKQVRGALDTLKKSGLILKGNFNKLPFDRTAWYALTDEAYTLLNIKKIDVSGCPNEEMPLPEKANTSAQKVKAIPYVNHIINSDINIKEKDKKKDAKALSSPARKDENLKLPKHKNGSYQNVLLTDEEKMKLIDEFPADYKQRIERLSEYIASTGKSYKNHLATIRSWARRDIENETKTRGNAPKFDSDFDKEFDKMF